MNQKTKSISSCSFDFLLPNLQPKFVNGHRPKKLKSVVGIQKIIKRISASARLNIKRFVGVCIPLFKPIPTKTNELPIKPKMKNILNKQIFTIPKVKPSVNPVGVVVVVFI